jgi:8-oxo-dGTP pyrophosphatase MutT (NUDIX family)
MIPNNCENCGQPYTARQRIAGYGEEDGSLLCYGCGHRRWDNPIPVAVWVQPVEHEFYGVSLRTGLAIARRAIEPRLGTWNLLGGHIGNGETAEAGGRREWWEETGLSAHKEEVLRPYGTYANGKGHLLIATLAPPITLFEYVHAVLCPENDAFSVLWEEEKCSDLGFPIHQKIASKWFMEDKPSEPPLTKQMLEYAEQMMLVTGPPA